MSQSVSDAAKEIRAARYAGIEIDVATIVNGWLNIDAATIDILLEAAQYYRFRNQFDNALSFVDIANKLSEKEADSIRILTLKVHILSSIGRFEEARAEVQKLIDRYEIINPGIAVGEILAAIAMKEERSAYKDGWEAYWRERQDYVYLHICRQLIGVIASSASSVVDIGSNRTPILKYFRSEMSRYSVDPTAPFEGPGIISIRKRFQDWIPPEPINIGTCFQVIEHIPDCEKFCQAIIQRCEVALISVPYLEEPGVNPGHIHSMIDEITICRWFGRSPNYKYIAEELSGNRRIICLFDNSTSKSFSSMHKESIDSLRYRFRWSLEGSGVRPANLG